MSSRNQATLLLIFTLIVATYAQTSIPPAAKRFGPEALEHDTVLLQTKATVTIERAVAVDQEGPSTPSFREGFNLTWSMILTEICLGAIVAKFCQRCIDSGDPKKGGAVRVSPAPTKDLAAAVAAAPTRGGPADLVSPSPTSSPSRLALHEAARSADCELVESLLASGVASHQADAWGCTPLHMAVHAGSTAVCEALLRHNKSLVHAREAWDETPLHLAARCGRAQLATLLIHAGASLDPVNADDKTPLVLAGEGGHKSMCEVLLDAGAGAGDISEEHLPPLLSSLLVQRSLEEM